MKVELNLPSLFETTFYTLQAETNMISHAETLEELNDLKDSIRRKLDTCFKILAEATKHDYINSDTLVGLAKVLDRQNHMAIIYLLIQYAKLGEKEK